MVGLESLKPPQETRMLQQQEVACDRHLPDLLLESVDVCNVAAGKLERGRTSLIGSAEVAFARVPSFAYSIARLRIIVFNPAWPKYKYWLCVQLVAGRS